MKIVIKFVLICAVVTLYHLAHSADYSRMFVFGDSLSDVGNVACGEEKSNQGRWTNALVWNEYLAEKLGLSVPSKSKNYLEGESPEAGNTNFAHGGAMTSHGTTEILIPSVTQQVNDRYSLSGEAQKEGFDRYGVTFNSDDLVLIWGGANNLFFSGQTVLKDNFEDAGIRAANEMISSIADLIEKGAKTIVALNLPDIGITPCYANNDVESANASLFSTSFNTTFAVGISELKATATDVNIIDIDVYSIFNQVMENPQEYGIDNTSDQYIDAQEGDETKYLFFDDVHPAEAGHILIADTVYAAIVNIPEPSTYAAIIGMLSLALAIYRRVF